MIQFKSCYFLLLLPALLFSCAQETKSEQNEKISAEVEQTNQLPAVETTALVRKWNDAHEAGSVSQFNALFDAEVIYYKSKLSREKCVEKKASFLQKHPDYQQEIIGEIQADTLSADEIKYSFVKEVHFDGQNKRYAAYLHAKKRGQDWKITEEGDETTDLNLQKKKTPVFQTDEINKIAGDFDGDGTEEYMWLEQPQFPPGDEADNFGECLGDCVCKIRFSNPAIAVIELESCIGGVPINKGDLDGNGTDEIGILPDWWTSCWRNYQVYTFKNKNWDYLLPPFSTHCTQWDSDFGFIQKHPSKKGYVIIEYSAWEDDDIRVRKKTVRII